MIERIDGMPDGVIGLRASGKLSKDDYVGVLEPALNAGIATGDLRLLFVLDDFDGLEPGVWIEDVKTGLRAIVRDHAAWTRFAFVTDVEWIARATRMFTWTVPGDARVYGSAERAEAERWVAGGG